MKPHLILPMGGAGSRFYRNGYAMPKPLIEIAGMPFFFWATKSIEKFVDISDLMFVTLREHIEKFCIDIEIKHYFPGAKIVVIPDILPGPVFTCIEGAKIIRDDAPVVFNDCDHMFKSIAFNHAIENGLFDNEGALLTFEASEQQFSYVRYNELGHVVGTAEKMVVSNKAICGAYAFRNARVFLDVAQKYIRKNKAGECFMSGLYNTLCAEGKKVADYPLDFHVSFGTPEEYENAKESGHFVDLL